MKIFRSLLGLNLLALGCTFAACGTDQVTTPPEDPEVRRAFIQKAHRALHPTAEALSDDRVDAFMAMSNEEIVEQLYDDPATIEAVLKISLNFVGAPVDKLHNGSQWAAEPFNFASAVAAARAFRDKRDPMTELFTTHATQLIGSPLPVQEDFLAFYYPDLEPFTGSLADRRTKVVDLLHGTIAEFRTFVEGQPDQALRSTVCNQFGQTPLPSIAFDLMTILGVPAPVIQSGQPPSLYNNFNLTQLGTICDTFTGKVPRATVLAEVDALRGRYDTLIGELNMFFDRGGGSPDAAFDLLDVTQFGWIAFDNGGGQGGFGQYPSHFYPTFWQLALNSSTNFDRRRGAYVLDRYFCDDLKPVGAALPEAHVGGKHASDPNCQACHYKLDPMAGFFRRHGFAGTEFTDELLQQNAGFITFDDGAQIQFSEYDASWFAEPGSSRPYNIGYIRSTHDQSANSYGVDLADLDTLLKTAPEVERCFNKRLFEYFNGSEQAVDPGFLEDVSADAHEQGANRLRRAVTRILAGETFRTPKRNTNTCYDLEPGAIAKNRPPCEVASTLKASCTSCHSPALAQGGLDLTVWEKANGSGGFGFKHIVDGKQLDRAETFKRMLDRVSTADLAKQMPLGLDMALRKREDLVLWLRAQVEAASQ